MCYFTIAYSRFIVSVAIISSSSVGMTTTFTFESSAEMMHSSPRVNEIAYDVDETPYAYYIQQAQNGLYAREAIICDVLGITLEDVKADKTIIE